MWPSSRRRTCTRCGIAISASPRSQPRAKDEPFHWRWRDIEPFLHRSVGEVSINDIERRALIMAHPAFGDDTTTTSTLLAAFTVLDPGDRARPHRHTGAAIRFATRAEGAATIVNGRRCEMHDGDLILTPPMCWHGHINESDHRIIWFDAANMPLIRAVDAHFFEPGDPRNNAFWQVDDGEEELWTEAGLVGPRRDNATTRIRRNIAIRHRRRGPCSPHAPAGADGARMVRYVNPATGGAVMPTLDCYAMRLTKEPADAAEARDLQYDLPRGLRDRPLDRRREEFDWSQHDVFTIPHWTWAEPRGERRRRRPVSGFRQVRVRAARSGARRDAISHVIAQHRAWHRRASASR